jgi:hypothetical protein
MKAGREAELIAALAAGDTEQAAELARLLHEQGYDGEALLAALAAQPQLETQLWATLDAVIPVARRVRKRRAIQAAEARDWGDWQEGQRRS